MERNGTTVGLSRQAFRLLWSPNLSSKVDGVEANREARKGKYRVGALAEGQSNWHATRWPEKNTALRSVCRMVLNSNSQRSEIHSSGACPDKLPSYCNTYAQLNQFDWSNL